MAKPCRRKIQELIGLMQKNLECSICLDMMNNPVSTNCGHQFCRFCLMEFLERKKQVPCPLCKKMITKRSLMDRSQLGQMVDNVRSLISAFQCDTGMLFSPPRGPQTVDLFPCTPDSIHAKTTTDTNRRSVTGAEKKVVKGRNVRIGRRKTVDNSDLGLAALSEQSSNSGASRRVSLITNSADHLQSDGIVLQQRSKRIMNKARINATETASSELLQCIEKGDHCSTRGENLETEPYVNNSKLQENTLGSIHVPQNVADSKEKVQKDGAEDSEEAEIMLPQEICYENFIPKTRTQGQHSKSPNSLKDAFGCQKTHERDTLESHNENDNSDSIQDIVIESGPLFQTPLVSKANKLGNRQADRSEVPKSTARELRSRQKQVKPADETKIELDCTEQLTPDTMSEKVNPFELTQGDHDEIKTYSKKGLSKQDKQANKKVMEWLEAVTAKDKRKAVRNARSSVNGMLKEETFKKSKKGLKLKADEEKMGQKLKHLAEHVDVNISDSCFGFDDTDREIENTGARPFEITDEKSTVTKNVLDNKNHTENMELKETVSCLLREEVQITESDGFCPEEVNKNGICIIKDSENRAASDNYVDSVAKTDEKKYHSVESFKEDVKNSGLLNKKRIFKARLLNKENVSDIQKETAIVVPKSVSPESKYIDMVVKDSSKTVALCPGVENKTMSEQSLPNSDPYEFKSSQNTPKKVRKRKRQKANLGKAKKNSSQAKDSMKSAKPVKINKTSSKNAHEKSKSVEAQLGMQQKSFLDDTPISCTQEEIKKMSNKINQAEDYDLLTCTQEAVDSIEDNDILRKVDDLDGDMNAIRKFNSEIIEIDADSEERKLKSSQLKRVRFREPVISDFIQPGKIDILGYRKAKENAKKVIENKHDSDTELSKVKANESSESAGPALVDAPKRDVCINDNTCENILSVDTKDKTRKSRKVIERNDAIKSSPACKTTVSNLSSPNGVFKNPMMTPTILKSGKKETSGYLSSELVEEEANSSGTDDLEINPEQDQFEEPNFDIQPDEIKDKLSSQELFVQNVLSTPKESATMRPSPQLIEETPALYVHPKLTTFQNYENSKRARKKSSKSPTITSLTETPLIELNESPCLSLKEPVPETYEEKHQAEKEVASGIEDGSSGYLNEIIGRNERVIEESDKTSSPNDVVILSNEESKLFSSNSHKETMTRNLESDRFEGEGSGENSVSLLDQESQLLVHMNRSKINRIQDDIKSSENRQLIQNKPSISLVTPNTEDIADKVCSVDRSLKRNKVSDSYQEILKDEPVMKKKKRKSFMLDDNETLRSHKQIPPPEVTVAQDYAEQKPKRKRLSSSNSPRLQEVRNTSQETRDESVNKDIKDSEISLQSGDLNRKETGVNKTKEDSIKQNSEVMVLDNPANMTSFEKDFTASKIQSQTDAYDIVPSAESLQAAELTQENIRITDEDFTVCRDSDVRVTESIESDISTVDPQNIDFETLGASQTACVSQGNKFEKGSDGQMVLRENSLGTSKTRIEIDSIHMVPETEMIDFGSMPQSVNVHESHICEGMDVECSAAFTKEEKKMDDGNCEDAVVDETQVTNKMLQISQPQRCALSKDRSKKYKNTGLEINETRIDMKQRHSSGILISPEENELASSCKGSPEDIFNIDSEMPFVDSSPFDETIKPAYLSEEETITNSCIKAQESIIQRKIIQRNECEKTVSMNTVSDETDIENINFDENEKVKNSKLEEINNSRKHRNSIKDKSRSVKQKKPDTDSESDLSQQERKKRRSGLKGARGFAGRNKHSNSSGCSSDLTSPITKKLVSSITQSGNKHDPIEPEINELSASRFVPNVNSPESHSLTNDTNLSNNHISDNEQHPFEIKQAHNTAQEVQISLQRTCTDVNNTKDGSEAEMPDHNGIEDLPDLSQINSSTKTQNAEIMVKKEMLNCEAKQDSLRNKVDRLKNISQASSLEHKMVQCRKDKNHMKNTAIDNEFGESLSQISEKRDEPEQCNHANDTSSSEFELNSSSEQVDSHKKINEEEEINNCIKEARNRIIDLENTFSEILSDADHESPQNSQESEKNTNIDNMCNFKIQKPRKTDKTIIGVKLENCNSDTAVKCVVTDSESRIESPKQETKVVSSSPQPDAITEEPMEVLESDIEPSESDSDDGPVIRKKSKKAVIADSSSEDEDDSSRHMNMTSSSAFSSQSENLTTQDRNALEKDLERMAREMEALKSQLRKGQGPSTDTENSTKIGDSNMPKNQRKSSKDSLDHQVVTVDDDTDIDELIEMDDSDRDHSDNDLFMSPPPLSLSQDHVAETASKQPTQTDQEECRTPSEKTQTSITGYKQRTVLGDLDVNRPPSPGRRIPRAFLATGLTLHQVQEVKKLASLNDCKFYNKFNESVTHVIVKPAAESEYLCDRTLKLFQGIANKCWIVNYYWVVDSRHAGHLLPEGPYEIQGDTANGEQHQGPLKSRTSPTRLFDNFVFMCVGDCPGLSVDDMVSLIQTCGGEIVPSVDQLRSGEKTSLIVTCSEVEDDDGDVQLSSQDVARFNKMYRSHGVVTVSREWILDSLTLYQLQPLKEYVITSVKNMVVPKIVPCQKV